MYFYVLNLIHLTKKMLLLLIKAIFIEMVQAQIAIKHLLQNVIKMKKLLHQRILKKKLANNYILMIYLLQKKLQISIMKQLQRKLLMI